MIEFLITRSLFMFLATFIVMFVSLELVDMYKRYVRSRKNSYDKFLEEQQILQEKMEQKKRESEL